MNWTSKVTNNFGLRAQSYNANLNKTEPTKNNDTPARNAGFSRCTTASASTAVQLRARPRPPGTEFLDAETKRQKSSFKRANARRDQNLGNEWPEIPAETHYLASYWKYPVCGDWMVGTTGIEPVTPTMSR
jgi:hypothetical protein